MSEKFIIIDLGAKIQTIADCVKLKPAQSYAKTITQGIEYNGNAGVSLVITNYCSQLFNVPSIEWFTDIDDGGNFRAYTDAFTILASQEISVPLKFEGTYLSDTLSHIYNLNLNGHTSTFNLTIEVPFVNHPPIVSNFSKLLENRAEYTFTLADFSSNFTDSDGDSLDLVNIIGDVSNFKLNGVAYVSGGDITVYNLNNGQLKYISPSVNSASQKTVSYTANDTHGAKSNVATITMNSKAFCTAPTLTSVDRINNNTVTFIWNNNGVEYGSGATISLEVSTDGGTTYTSLVNVSPSASPYTISSGVINSIANGGAVKFRVTSNGSPCNTQNSNVITQTWLHASNPPTAIVSQDSEGTNTDNINNSSNKCYLYATNFQVYDGAVITYASWQIRNITTDSGWIDLETAIEGSGESFVTNNMDFGFRVKLVDSNGLEGYSNVLSKYYTLELNSFEVDFYNDGTSACSATSGNGLQGFTTITPIEGDVCYNFDSTPHTGSFSYIKIFNYGNVTGNNVVFAINGSTGVLGAINEC